MRAMEFIGLLSTFRVPRSPDKGYTIMIPLREIIEVFEKNNLIVVSKDEWAQMGIEELIKRTPTEMTQSPEEAEPVDIVERIQHIEEKSAQDRIDLATKKRVEAEG